MQANPLANTGMLIRTLQRCIRQGGGGPYRLITLLAIAEIMLDPQGYTQTLWGDPKDLRSQTHHPWTVTT